MTEIEIPNRQQITSCSENIRAIDRNRALEFQTMLYTQSHFKSA